MEQKRRNRYGSDKKRKYPESLEQYTGDILLVGINYDKKEKAHQCVIEKWLPLCI